MQHDHDLAARHLRLLVEVVSRDHDELEKDETLSSIQRLEGSGRGRQLRMVEMIQALGLDEREAWCLRYAAGRAVAAAIDRTVSRTFTLADLSDLLEDLLGVPALALASAMTGDAALARNGVVARERTRWAGWASFQLAAGFEAWFLGQAPAASEGTRPLHLPGWVRDLAPVQDVAARLAARQRRQDHRALVLLCHDPIFAAAVAAEVVRNLERTADAWLCPYTKEAESDPLPMLVWASEATGRDTVIVSASDDSIYDVPTRLDVWRGLDLRRRSTRSTVWVIQSTLDPDPLDLRAILPVLDLQPLWIGQGALAIRRALEQAAQTHLHAPLHGQLIRSVQASHASVGMHSMALHREVLGEVATRAIPDLVNREACISAYHGLSAGDDDDKGHAHSAPDTTVDCLVLDEATRAVFDHILERAREGKRCVVLASGSPGVGKSFSARCLAGSLGRPFAEARASELRGRFYGQEENWLRQLFERAESRGEILVFDEADEWVGRREGSSAAENGGRIMESSEMLLNLERFSGVAVLTTNRVEVLDPALHRRVDVWLRLKSPGATERMALWSRALSERLPLAPSFLVALSAVRLTGGDIDACVRQVEATHGELTAQALFDAARERASMQSLLG